MNATSPFTRIAVLVAAATAFLLPGCATRTASDYDPTRNVSSYSTFAFMERQRGPNEAQPALRQIEDAIRARLEHKGFTLTRNPGTADAIVDFTLGTYGRIDVHSYPAPYAGDWFWNAQLRTGPYWGENIDPLTYRDGILSIDIFDHRTHRPIWHGWSKVVIPPSDAAGSGDSIQRIVHDILAEYPPGHMQ